MLDFLARWGGVHQLKEINYLIWRTCAFSVIDIVDLSSRMANLLTTKFVIYWEHGTRGQGIAMQVEAATFMLHLVIDGF